MNRTLSYERSMSMAMIKCPECGASVSSAAANCISCGYPINAPTSYASIRFEQTYAVRYTCTVTCNGKDYTCKQGESVEVPLTTPADVRIHISGGNGSCTGTIAPGRKYSVSNGGGFFGFKPVLSAY